MIIAHDIVADMHPINLIVVVNYETGIPYLFLLCPVEGKMLYFLVVVKLQQGEQKRIIKKIKTDVNV